MACSGVSEIWHALPPDKKIIIVLLTIIAAIMIVSLALDIADFRADHLYCEEMYSSGCGLYKRRNY